MAGFIGGKKFSGHILYDTVYVGQKLPFQR